MRGWVYVITNNSMPGLVKIGYSTKDPELRAKELANTGAPHSYVVEYDVLVDEPRMVEQELHRSFSEWHEDKEWFRCDVSQAIQEIRRLMHGKFLLENFRNQETVTIIHDVEQVTEQECWYYNCEKPGLIHFQNHNYCEEHYQLLHGHFAGPRSVGSRNDSRTVKHEKAKAQREAQGISVKDNAISINEIKIS